MGWDYRRKRSTQVAPNWYLPCLFDVGTGDKTELTWQAFGGVGYKFKNFDLIVAYRHMAWDFDDSNPLSGEFTDLTVSGPIIGIRFNF